jgi:hypothetical protein
MIERKGAVPAVSFTMKDQQRLEVADSWTTNADQALRMIQREGESPGAGGFQPAEQLTSAGGGTLTPVLETMPCGRPSAEEKETTGMRKIVDVVPALPRWSARRRFTPEHTISYPVTVWVIVDEPDTSTRRAVADVDASGPWPGAADNDPGAEFVRYLYLAPQDGQPEDIVNPVHPGI